MQDEAACEPAKRRVGECMKSSIITDTTVQGAAGRTDWREGKGDSRSQRGGQRRVSWR